jgi:hypothetical protein|tara:strand:- start:131 stop:292 length:162 start_codon:yes stop_codon:yes gene_type:complete
MSVEKAAKTLFLLLSATTQKPLGEVDKPLASLKKDVSYSIYLETQSHFPSSTT